LGGVGVGFLTTLVVGFICPTPTPDVQLDNFLYHIPKLGIPAELVISFETFVETEISCCVPRFPLVLTDKFHSFMLRSRSRESESDILPPTPQPWAPYIFIKAKTPACICFRTMTNNSFGTTTVTTQQLLAYCQARNQLGTQGGERVL